MTGTIEIHDRYAAQVGGGVTLADDTVVVAGTLTACEQFGTDGTSFALTFVMPDSTFQNQGTYLVTIGDNEPEPMFLVPAASSTEGTTFHATFTSAPPKGTE